MSAMPDEGSAAPTVAPMEVELLDDVLRIETEAYSFPWTRGNFIDSLIANHLAWCLMDMRKAVIGYAIVMPGVEELHLLNLTVAATHRRQGHALLLLKRLMAHGRNTMARSLWLEVRPSNAAARSLYMRLGFERIGVRRQYYPDTGNRREDAWVMRLDLGGSTRGSNEVA